MSTCSMVVSSLSHIASTIKQQWNPSFYYFVSFWLLNIWKINDDNIPLAIYIMQG